MTQQPTFKPADLADLVRTARLEQRLSKSAVAQAAGLSREWLRLLEAGERPDRPLGQPKPENIRALALVLRIDEQTALNLAGHSPDAPITHTGGRPSCSEAAFNANVNRLPASVRGLVMQLVEAVAATGDNPKNGAAA